VSGSMANMRRRVSLVDTPRLRPYHLNVDYNVLCPQPTRPTSVASLYKESGAVLHGCVNLGSKCEKQKEEPTQKGFTNTMLRDQRTRRSDRFRHGPSTGRFDSPRMLGQNT